MEEVLTKIVKEFVEKHRISCPEIIYDSDRVIVNAYRFIEALCNVVGYAKIEDEDEDEDEDDDDGDGN